MCLWLLTACLGILPTNTPLTNVIVVGAPPPPILVPTTTTTTARPVNMTGPPMNMTGAPGPPSTAAPTMGPPVTAAPTMGPPQTAAPTMGPPATAAPTMGPPQTAAPTMGPAATIGGVLLPVILCDNPDIVCIINPDETAAGSIDPRLGTTPSPSAALQVPPIIGYSAQAQSYDTAVRFPRERRSIMLGTNSNSNPWDRFGMPETGSHQIRKRQAGCRCVAAGTCTNNGMNAGAGLIDIRIVTPGGGSGFACPAGQELCCGTSATMVACGTRQTVPATAIAPGSGQADFGEYPWQALILTKQNDYIAGGVLIDQFNVITVTHRLSTYVVSGTAPNVKVRLGEWDAAGTYEPVAFQEYTVSRVFSHPSFNPSTLQYDITVLRLSTPVPLTPMTGSTTTINRACLPPSSTSTYTGQRCWVSGWGKNMFGLQGQYQQILKEVDVPIVDSATCQTQMRNARLGPNFILDPTSFICAGGEANKDACTGDGGSGLVCQVNGQWAVVGLVAWGLGCANANVPAAYVNIAALLPWIQTQVATS